MGKKRLEFFLLRYVPNAVRSRFINIGIVLFDPETLLTGFCQARFISGWDRLQSFDDDADIEVLQAMASDIENQLSDPFRRQECLQSIEDSFSNAIQLSPREECVTENPWIELEDLSHRYLFPTEDAGTRHVA